MGRLQIFPYSSYCCKSDHTHLSRNNFEKLFLWQQGLLEHDSSSLPRRRTRIIHLTPHLLPLNLNLHSHSHSHSLPFRHHTFLPCPAFCPVLRSCSPPLSSPMSSLTPNSTPHSTYSSTSDASSVTYMVVIKGRVQGVFYRDWTVQNAIELGLAGWVRNRRDGSVEALFSGPADKVQEMQQRCRSGPPAAIVTGLEASPSNEDPGSGFERRRTV